MFVTWITCIHKHYHRMLVVLITNRIWALRGNILFLLHWLTHAWLHRALTKCTCMNHVTKELCLHKSSESGFLGGPESKTPLFSHFRSLIWKSFACTKGKIRFSNQERLRITIWSGFRTVIRSFVNRPRERERDLRLGMELKHPLCIHKVKLRNCFVKQHLIRR